MKKNLADFIIEKRALVLAACLAMLTRHFRQLWRVKELCAKRVPLQEIGKAAGINPLIGTPLGDDNMEEDTGIKSVEVKRGGENHGQ